MGIKTRSAAWAGLVGIAVAVSGVMIAASWRKPLRPLELALFQVIVLGIGLAGSFLGGRSSARQSARDMVASAAKPAFRRLLAMYEALKALGEAMLQRRQLLREYAASQEGRLRQDQAESALDVLYAHLVSQIATANHAMDDWRDLVPKEVEEIERRARQVAETQLLDET